jgi:hypothetical protein
MAAITMCTLIVFGTGVTGMTTLSLDLHSIRARQARLARKIGDGGATTLTVIGVSLVVWRVLPSIKPKLATLPGQQPVYVLF